MSEEANRLIYDTCAVGQRDADNRGISCYGLTNLRPSPYAKACAQGMRSMHTWDGYGWNVAEVDRDTRLRLESRNTHPRSKVQLSTRVFVAAPDLAQAGVPPFSDADAAEVIFPGPREHPCESLTEVDYDRFVPGICAIPVDNIVPSWTYGGDSSRDISRSAKFQKALRKSCGGPPPLPMPAVAEELWAASTPEIDAADDNNKCRARLLRATRPSPKPLPVPPPSG